MIGTLAESTMPADKPFGLLMWRKPLKFGGANLLLDNQSTSSIHCLTTMSQQALRLGLMKTKPLHLPNLSSPPNCHISHALHPNFVDGREIPLNSFSFKCSLGILLKKLPPLCDGINLNLLVL